MLEVLSERDETVYILNDRSSLITTAVSGQIDVSEYNRRQINGSSVFILDGSGRLRSGNCPGDVEDSPPYLHDLERLADHAGMRTSMSESQLDLIDELNPLNIEARYPKSKEELLKVLTHRRCQKLIERTEELLLWIKML